MNLKTTKFTYTSHTFVIYHLLFHQSDRTVLDAAMQGDNILRTAAAVKPKVCSDDVVLRQ